MTGYVDYLITYPSGEEWSETRPFYDIDEHNRLTVPEFCETMASDYGAVSVKPSVYVGKWL